MIPDSSHPPSIPPAEQMVLPGKQRYIPNLASILFTLFVLLILAALLIPTTGRVGSASSEVRAMAQAKQIGLALKLFAGDHDGMYPSQGFPVEMTQAPGTSNAAFACLFPTYTTSESIFGNKFSAYQTRQPDNVIDPIYTGKPAKTLEPGENVYAYVAGLTEDSDPSAPLVLDGTDGTHLYYNSTRAVRGGVWEGKRAVVIRLDNSGALGKLTGRDNTRYVPVSLPNRPKNLLDLSWLGKDVRLLDPAIAPE